jgi:hypothetical protein
MRAVPVGEKRVLWIVVVGLPAYQRAMGKVS